MPEAPGQPFALRLAAEGPPIQGVQDGDTMVWNASSKQWVTAQPGASGNPPAVGALGTWYISNGFIGYWGNDVSPQNIISSGSLLIGPGNRFAGTAAIKTGYGQVLLGSRNQANTADQALLSWGVSAADAFQVGVTGKGMVRLLSSGQWDIFIGSTREYILGTALMNVEPDAQATWTLSSTSVAIMSIFSRSTNSERNVSWFTALTNVSDWNGAKYVMYQLNCVTAPSGNPVGGAYIYESTTGQRVHWGTAGTITVMAPP